MYKLIKSYNISSGIVHFDDGTKKKFKKESIVMIDKMIYMLANIDSNFEPPDLTTDDGIDEAIDMLHSE